MKQFIQAHSKGKKCDICGRKTEPGEQCYIVIQEDSIEILCWKCGDYFWKLLESLMRHFQSALQGRESYKKIEQAGKERK